jgi:hypothetical protein
MVRMSDALSQGSETTLALHRPTDDIMRARIAETVRTMFSQVPAIDFPALLTCSQTRRTVRPIVLCSVYAVWYALRIEIDK